MQSNTPTLQSLSKADGLAACHVTFSDDGRSEAGHGFAIAEAWGPDTVGKCEFGDEVSWWKDHESGGLQAC